MKERRTEHDDMSVVFLDIHAVYSRAIVVK